jgi:P-type Cu+ transporter
VRHASQALQGVDGVERVRLNLESGLAQVACTDNTPMRPVELLQALDKAGFKGRLVNPERVGVKQSAISGSGWGYNLVLGIPALLFMMLAEWVLNWEALSAYRNLSLILGTLVFCGGGVRFFRGAWTQLRRGKSNMDTLVSLGASAAYGYSIWAWWTGQALHLYFMETVGVITLISLGHWLEARISTQTSTTLESLMRLSPQRARRQEPGGGFVEVDVITLQLGDLVEVSPGEQVPTDGVVLQGESSVDESMLSGESMPVDKVSGQCVYAATSNRQGRMVLRVTALGEATALARIIKVVEQAQCSGASIQRLGDQVSAIFVPLVVLVSMMTLVSWIMFPQVMQGMTDFFSPYLWSPHRSGSLFGAAIMHAVSVLIVACPCAMGLATPVAIMAGTNVAASRGILIRDGQALEKSGKITTLAFDKTGTLTQGRPELVSFECLKDGLDAQALSGMVASIASGSMHPLSRALASMEGSTPPLSEVQWTAWEECSGRGIRAQRMAHGRDEIYMLGSLAWLRQSGICLDGVAEFQERWMQNGATVLGFACDQQLLAAVALKDTLKPHARQVLAGLRSEGWAVQMITGDHRVTGEAIARELGLPTAAVYAEVSAERKARMIEQWQQEGERVAFVGDGINDAPALEQADLGIAVSRASDMARESSDMVLLKADIEAIPEALGLARATLATIKQNLFWAFFYNAAAIPLAIFGFMNPLLCAAAMGASDLVVIGNALRLTLRDQKKRGRQ